MSTGTILVLNGTSSSGKTSLLAALQEVLEEPFLSAGIDKFLWMLPKRYLNQPLWSEVFEYSWTGNDPQEMVIRPGPLGNQLISGMHHALVGLALAGNNVLVDHVLLEETWVQGAARLVYDLPAYLIGVHCPLEVVEQRERERKDRTLGQARAQFNVVHAHTVYDLDVETHHCSPAECAMQIKRYLDGGARPRAFRQLATRFTIPPPD